jgi:uncharacterized protein (DUF2147 family)
VPKRTNTNEDTWRIPYDNGKNNKYLHMKNLILITLSFVLNISEAQVAADNIVGNWISPKKDSEIQIFKVNNKYFGKIIWGEGESTKDLKNPDIKMRNRDLIGLIILSNFHFEEDEWSGGTIYDPREGKTYSCVITMNNKTEINIRGYVGIAMFGRAEVWTKKNNQNSR